MIDLIEKWGHSLVQHGPLSNRIYLMKLASQDMPAILDTLDKKAGEKGYTKIFAKIPAAHKALFLKRGYREEALIPFFFNGKETVLFMGKYPEKGREKEKNPDDIGQILKESEKKSGERDSSTLPAEFIIEECIPSDTPAMSRLYQEVFKSYPFPIFDPDYLKKTMETHIRYFGVKKEGQFVALSSAEVDFESQNVEMTDFATLPAFRGRGLAFHLLQGMEEKMREEGILTAYTIARALSPGINLTFARAGYTFSGTLINNTQIEGHIESMNIWHKKLKSSP